MSRPNLIEAINEHYNKRELEILCRKMLDDFFSAHLQHPDVKKFRAAITSRKGNIAKSYFVEVLAALYDDPGLFKDLLQHVAPPVAQTFHILTWEGMKKADFLEKKFQVRVAEKQPIFSYRNHPHAFVENDFYFFSIQHSSAYYRGDYSYRFLLYLPDPVRHRLKDFLDKPAGYHIVPLKSPDDTAFNFENKDGILRELPLLATFIRQGHLKLSKQQKPLKSSLKKMQKFCEVQEFYGEEDKALAYLRITLLANLLNSISPLKEDDQPLALLQTVWQRYLKGDFSNLQYLLDHLKGIGYLTSSYYNQEYNVNEDIGQLLKVLPENQWVSMKNLLQYVHFREIPPQPVSPSEAYNYLYIHQSGESAYYYQQTRISSHLYFDCITAPLLKASMFLFAALGMVDIGYDLPENPHIQTHQNPYLSRYDGVRYVRLTPLGAYLLGKREDYEIEILEDKTEYVLDDSWLILSVFGEDKRAGMILSEFATAVSENRYKVDYASFLKGCSSRADVEKKINLFKSAVTNDLPPNWQDFFVEILGKVDPLTAKNQLRVFKVAEDPKLLELFARDSTLKRLVLKGENYHIAVAKKDYSLVKQVLKSHGYLIT